MKTYLVGGAVRDKLMGLENHDRDFVIVGATSEQILALGYEQVGADFPVFLSPNGDQYALARKERKVGIGYAGFEVEFDSSVTLEEDLMRRDLTINAIAIDINTGDIHDPYNGRNDIDNKILRHVSDAFAEDPLRVIRLARFASRFSDFTIAPNTIVLCKNIVQSGELDSISNERFIGELVKMFNQANDPFIFFNVLWQTGAINCKFFVDLFGGFDQMLLENARRQCEIVMHMHPGNGTERLQYFVAFAARSSAAMVSTAIPAEIKWMHKEINKLIKIAPRDADAVMDIFVRNRAFNSTDFKMRELLSTMHFAERFSKFCSIKALVLRDCLQAATSVLAADFVDQFKGAELGSVLYRERLLRVQEILFSNGNKT